MSKFCLNIAGDTPSSNRLFDAIVSHCVPMIISDEIELPFEDVLDYSEFSVFVRASDAVKKGYLLNLLHSIKREEWTKMWERLKEITNHFEYQYPSQSGDAVNMIWQEVARKISSMQFNSHRKNRYNRSQLLVKSNWITEIHVWSHSTYQWERNRPCFCYLQLASFVPSLFTPFFSLLVLLILLINFLSQNMLHYLVFEFGK